MTELSKRIQEYIRRSQVTVYQLAKNTNLDRTMIQKMIKGTKYPGTKFFYKFCDALMVNKDEKEELIRLFRIEKTGSAKYNTRQAVRKFLSEFWDITTEYFSGSQSGIYPVLGEQTTGVDTKELRNRNELMLHIYGMICEAMRRNGKVSIWMDVSTLTDVILQTVYVLKTEYKAEVVVNHHILLSYQGNTPEGSADNIEMLNQVFPAAFVLGTDYHAYYSYIHSVSEDRRYTPFRHYCLCGDNMLVYNDTGDHGLFFSNGVSVGAFLTEIERIRMKSNALFRFWDNLNDFLEEYEDALSESKLIASYEMTPFSHLLSAAADVTIHNTDGKTRHNLSAFKKKVLHLMDEDYFQIFGMSGMERFVRTGRLPEIFGTDKVPFSVDDRIELASAYEAQLCRNGNSYLLKEDQTSGFNIALYAPNKLVICVVRKELPFGCMMLEETGVFESFLDYLHSLIEYEEVYSPEESADEVSRRMECFFAQASG